MAPNLPNLKRLLIPGKTDRKAHPGYATDMRTIERFVNAIPPPPPGRYASLTGPGETNPTGKLTQAGDFEVDGNLIADKNVTAVGGTTHDIATSNPNPSEMIMQASGTTVTVSTPGGVRAELALSTTAASLLFLSSGFAVGSGTSSVSGPSVAIQPDIFARLSFYGATGFAAQPLAITPPVGGGVVDTQARTAIDAIITLLTTYGLTA